MNLFLLLAGLALVLYGANLLTEGSASLAARFRVPEFIVGLTVVAVGTSTPELVVSLLSALRHQSDLAIGNVVGSNVFNVFVILGLSALIAPIALTTQNMRRDIPVGLGASLLLIGMVAWPMLHGQPGRITRGEGVGMLLLYAAVMVYTVRSSRRQVHPNSAPPARQRKGWLVAVMIAVGLGGLVGGGELFLRGATAIARGLGISESVIAITLVAGGTSLPELASSVVSVLKHRPELALGNVIGSNVANILLVLGASASLSPLQTAGIGLVDFGMVVLSSLLLFLAAFTFRRHAIDRWEGGLFLAIYTGYILWLIH